MPRAITLLLLCASLLPGGACAPTDASPEGQAGAPVHIDSVFPIEEEIRRFRADLPDAPTALDAGSASSRDELIERFARALEAQDTTAFRDLVLSRAEFAYLYYPYTRYTRRPYELSPALLWFQIQQGSEKGIRRALRTWGGRSLEWSGYTCPDTAMVEGANHLWPDCVLQLRGDDGGETAKRLFGTIIERDGRFKFLSYSNDL